MSRIYSNNGYSIEYPNQLAYAGMPMVVRMSNYTDFVGAGITVNVGGEFYTETRTIYNGEAVFDISRYAQMAFTGKNLGYTFGEDSSATKISPLSQQIDVFVTLTDNDGVITQAISFSVMALFGYIGIQQANGGGIRKRRWFARYPQTFDFYLTNNSVVSLEIADGENISYENSVEEDVQQRAVELSPWYIVPRATDKRAKLIATESVFINCDNIIENATTIYDLLIDNCTSGVYLRWLDHFGHWCYYLFRTTGRNYATKEVQSWIDGVLRNELQPENDVYTGHSSQQLSQQESISLGAKLVDAETFDFLLTLTNSPIVEVLTNATEYQANNSTTPLWERVSIAGGSYARTGAPLQDFAVSIVRNAQTSQIL